MIKSDQGRIFKTAIGIEGTLFMLVTDRHFEN